MVTIQTLLSIIPARKWEIHQIDLHNSFLHGDLQEEVYMKLPPSFSRGHEGLVCRLQKYMITTWGLIWPQVGPSLLVCKVDWSTQTVQVSRVIFWLFLIYFFFKLHLSLCSSICRWLNHYRKWSPALQRFKTHLSIWFHMKDLGPLKYFLGIKVARNHHGTFLC